MDVLYVSHASNDDNWTWALEADGRFDLDHSGASGREILLHCSSRPSVAGVANSAVWVIMVDSFSIQILQ
jgi:hypothetical protein